MRNPRMMLLGGVLALLAGVVVWKWVSSWGTVTVNFKNAPLAKVIKTIERQGGVKISSNAPPQTPITMRTERMPVYEAMDTLALQIDGDLRLAFIAAPNDKQIGEVLAAYAGGNNPGGWAVFSSGGGWGRGMAMGSGETIPDPRSIEWKISDIPDKSLQTVLDQGSQKTGALFAVPQSWNPVIGRLPSGGKTASVTGKIVKGAKGKVREVFLVTVRPPRPEGERPGRGEDSVFSPRRGGNMNRDWMAERVQAQIALLPQEERADAQKQVDDMRAFFESVRNLSEEERRAKIEERMNSPEVQERMQMSMESRDNRNTPAKREQRMRRYLERKRQTQGQS